MNSRLPLRLVASAAMATALVLSACLLVGHLAADSVLATNRSALTLEALRRDVLLHDEALTMSARLAAASGDAEWIRRYELVEPKLIEAIDRLTALADDEAVAAAVGATAAANAELAAMERRAFELVLAGRESEAVALLGSAAYEFEKSLSTAGMRKTLDLTQRAHDRRAAVLRHRMRLSTFVAAGGLALLTLVWVLVVRRLAGWRHELERERRSRERAEDALQALNAGLEETVASRTEALERSEAQLSVQANVDELTGLSTRRRGVQQLDALLEESRREGGSVVAACLDIDAFRDVNETLGHGEGDRLLAEVATRLRERFGDDAQLARLGGDEFLVFRALAEREDVAVTTRAIESVFRAPFPLGEQRMQRAVGTSVGVAVSHDGEDDALKILRNADLAMYFAKRGGRGTTFEYDGALEESRQRRREIERGLREALDEGQFRLHYQPKFCLDSDRLCGAEALLRWTHPEMGQMFPDQFIPVAEESGLIVELGRWVIDEATRQIAQWRRERGFDFGVAVNVSPRQLHDRALLQVLGDALLRNDLSPASLQVELTESTLLENDAKTRQVIEGVAEIGCELALDDFGTGYSSLSYLKSYPFDFLKIDRSFVAGMLEDPQDLAVTRAVIALAHSLDLRAVAEGTEVIEQCDALRSLGCEMAQGYHYSRPLPPNEFAAFAAARASGASAAAGLDRLPKAS